MDYIYGMEMKTFIAHSCLIHNDIINKNCSRCLFKQLKVNIDHLSELKRIQNCWLIFRNKSKNFWTHCESSQLIFVERNEQKFVSLSPAEARQLVMLEAFLRYNIRFNSTPNCYCSTYTKGKPIRLHDKMVITIKNNHKKKREKLGHGKKCLHKIFLLYHNNEDQ